jgi:hypothetical protein
MRWAFLLVTIIYHYAFIPQGLSILVVQDKLSPGLAAG